MKRIAIITAALLLMSSVCFGQTRTARMSSPPSPLTGNATDGYSLPGSLAIGTTGGSSTLTLNGSAVSGSSGSSPYAINGDTTISASDLNKYYTVSLAASPIVNLSALTDSVPVFILADKTTAGNASGVTIVAVDTIYDGSGSAVRSGNTIFITGGESGNTLYQISLKADNFGGTLVWRVWSLVADQLRRP